MIFGAHKLLKATSSVMQILSQWKRITS